MYECPVYECCPKIGVLIQKPGVTEICTRYPTTNKAGMVYDKLLANKRATAKNILEIGVGLGGSLKVWQDYFPRAIIYGIDIEMLNPSLNCEPRIRVVLDDAYKRSTVDFMAQRKYDVIIDDGPHSLESMLFSTQEYVRLLVPGGIFVIENIQSPEWVPVLLESLGDAYCKKAYIVDKRKVTGQYDNLMMIIE